MKKLLVSVLVAAMIVPAFAEDGLAPETLAEATTDTANAAAADTAAGAEKVLDYDSDYNLKYVDKAEEAAPKQTRSASWLRGWQFGAGIPVLPLGYNGFVGYANKNAEGFWGKRFGARLDFQIPSSMKAGVNLVGNGNGYDAAISANVLFSSLKINEKDAITNEDLDIDVTDTPELSINGGSNRLNMDGAKLKFQMKNWNIGGLVDFYPFGNTWFLGGIRLSGGYYTGKLDASLMATMPENTFAYNVPNSGGDFVGAKLAGGQKIGANFAWKYSGPYAGLGFDLGFFYGVKMYFDAGVVFAKPPKVSRKDIKAPVLQACYKSSGSGDCTEWVYFDLNKKPNADNLVKDVMAQMINENVKSNLSALDQNTKDELANALGYTSGDLDAFLQSQNYGGVANNILDWMNGNVNSSNQWVQDLVSGSTDEIADALDNVLQEWQDSTSDFNSSKLQHDIDDAWADYDKGIRDMNDSLKDLRFMPVVKLGLMYRF